MDLESPHPLLNHPLEDRLDQRAGVHTGVGHDVRDVDVIVGRKVEDLVERVPVAGCITVV